MLIRGRYSEETVQSNAPMQMLIRQMHAKYPVRNISDEALLSMVVGLVSKAVIDQQAFGVISVEQKVEQIIEMCVGVIFSQPIEELTVSD